MEVDQVAEAASKAQQRLSNQNQTMCATELKFDSDRLKIFYERIFPYKMFFKWLSYNILKTRDEHTLVSIDDKQVLSDYFYNREFSFTLANDVYCRYLCFKTADEFK